jgi:hypothetical protein
MLMSVNSMLSGFCTFEIVNPISSPAAIVLVAAADIVMISLESSYVHDNPEFKF